MTDSPFVQFEDIFYQPHGSAQRLALMVLSMYNGTYFHFPLSQIRNFDSTYRIIADKLLAHFIEYGESDLYFVSVGTALCRAYMEGEILGHVKRADGVKRWKK